MQVQNFGGWMMKYGVKGMTNLICAQFTALMTVIQLTGLTCLLLIFSTKEMEFKISSIVITCVLFIIVILDRAFLVAFECFRKRKYWENEQNIDIDDYITKL